MDLSVTGSPCYEAVAQIRVRGAPSSLVKGASTASSFAAKTRQRRHEIALSLSVDILETVVYLGANVCHEGHTGRRRCLFGCTNREYLVFEESWGKYSKRKRLGNLDEAVVLPPEKV